jgi:cell division protein FtsQ
MHKRTHLTLADSRAAQKRSPKGRTPKARPNRRRRNWNGVLKAVAVLLFFVDAGMLLFANPALRVTHVRVDGVQTLTPQQVFDEAHVPSRTNLFWMLHQPLTKRLAADPVIDHAERTIQWPNSVVLTVAERQPYAVLSGHGQFWLLDAKGVPYRQLDRPLPHLPLLQVAETVLPETVSLGVPLPTVWLPDAYHLLRLASEDPKLSGAKITVDQNLNLCLNRKDRLQIRLGQPDSLPWKIQLADAALSAYGGALAQRAAYIDVSCPQQPVWRPHAAGTPMSKLDQE